MLDRRRTGKSVDWWTVTVSSFIAICVLMVSCGLDKNHSKRLDRLETDNALQSDQIKTLGEKVSR